MLTERPAHVPPEAMEHHACWEWREMRACASCGYQRLVRVALWKRTTEETWAKQCGMCDLLRRAAAHESTARTFRARAEIIRRQRQARLATET
jgi:hypothetical protein